MSAEAASLSLPVWEELAEAEPVVAGPPASGPPPVLPEAVQVGPVSVQAAEVLALVGPGDFWFRRPWEPLSSPVPTNRHSRPRR